MKKKPYKPEPITMYVGGVCMLFVLAIKCAFYLSSDEVAELRNNPTSEDVKQNYLLLIYESTK